MVEKSGTAREKTDLLQKYPDNNALRCIEISELTGRKEEIQYREKVSE